MRIVGFGLADADAGGAVAVIGVGVGAATSMGRALAWLAAHQATASPMRPMMATTTRWVRVNHDNHRDANSGSAGSSEG